MKALRNSALPMLLFAGFLLLMVFLFACQQNPVRPDAPAVDPEVNLPITAVIAPAQPSGSASVRVYIEIIIQRKYGFLAHTFGYCDATERRVTYDVNNDWWNNPLVVFADPLLPVSDAIAHADAAPLTGQGASSNVAVALTLIPHADITFKDLRKCDAIKGTITISISTRNDYFDDAWTPMLLAKDRRISFAFDTRTPGLAVKPIAHETRTLPVFVFQRYTRGHQRWDSRTNWPVDPKSEDFRTTIVGKDATLDITGYNSSNPPVITSSLKP